MSRVLVPSTWTALAFTIRSRETSLAQKHQAAQTLANLILKEGEKADEPVTDLPGRRSYGRLG